MSGQYAKELSDPEEIGLWDRICQNQGRLFRTSGRGSRKGVEFTYRISSTQDGRPGAEIFVSTRAKSITRSTVIYAFRKVKSMKEVKGPKSIGVHGDSYIYAIFRELGILPAQK